MKSPGEHSSGRSLAGREGEAGTGLSVEPPLAGLKGQEPISAGARDPLPFPRRVVVVLLATLALLLTAAMLDSVVPEPSDPRLEEKLAWYEEHRDRVDTLLIGSSRVFRQVNPDHFDEQMRAHGLESYSFNMGLPSMKLPEMYFILGQILDAEKANPKRIFAAIESKALTDVIDEENAGTSRVVYWHDLGSTIYAIELLWDHNERSLENLTERELWLATLEHAKSFLMKELNISQAASAIGAHFEDSSAERLRMTRGLVKQRGFSSLEARRGFRRRRNRLLRGAKKWERQVEHKARSYRRPAKEGVVPETVETLETLARPVRRVGSELVLFVAPNPKVDSRWMEGIATLDAFGPVLIYDDPNRHPDLYRRENYFDLGHLNDQASRRFTSLLVQDYALWKQERDSGTSEDDAP